MNKDYIKRLIILNELNISIDEEIKYYIDLFKSKYVDENLEKITTEKYQNYIFWTKDEDVIFYYCAYNDTVYTKYDQRVFGEDNIIDLFKFLFELKYNLIKVDNISAIDDYIYSKLKTKDIL